MEINAPEADAPEADVPEADAPEANAPEANAPEAGDSGRSVSAAKRGDTQPPADAASDTQPPNHPGDIDAHPTKAVAAT